MRKLYRAMCQEEYEQTIRCGGPAWKSKNKWFGPLEFVESRVRDGRFNNSHLTNGRYDRIVEFILVSGEEHFKLRGPKEWMLNIRKSPLVKMTVSRVVL